MSVSRCEIPRDVPMAVSANIADTVRARLLGGLVGGAIVSSDHPNYLDPNVIIGGFMSHLFYAVPLALVVKHRLAPAAVR
jgi:hypothetical protein